MVNKNLQGKKVPKENTSYKYLSLINHNDSVVKVNEKYYPQTILEECKYEIKTKMENFINDDLDPSSSDGETDSNSDNDESKKSDNESDKDSDNETVD